MLGREPVGFVALNEPNLQETILFFTHITETDLRSHVRARDASVAESTWVTPARFLSLIQTRNYHDCVHQNIKLKLRICRLKICVASVIGKREYYFVCERAGHPIDARPLGAR